MYPFCSIDVTFHRKHTPIAEILQHNVPVRFSWLLTFRRGSAPLIPPSTANPDQRDDPQGRANDIRHRRNTRRRRSERGPVRLGDQVEKGERIDQRRTQQPRQQEQAMGPREQGDGTGAFRWRRRARRLRVRHAANDEQGPERALDDPLAVGLPVERDAAAVVGGD